MTNEFTKAIQTYYIYNKLYLKIYKFHEFKEKYSNTKEIEEFKDIYKLILVADELFGDVREQAYKELYSTAKNFTQGKEYIQKEILRFSFKVNNTEEIADTIIDIIISKIMILLIIT